MIQGVRTHLLLNHSCLCNLYESLLTAYFIISVGTHTLHSLQVVVEGKSGVRYWEDFAEDRQNAEKEKRAKIMEMIKAGLCFNCIIFPTKLRTTLAEQPV